VLVWALKNWRYIAIILAVLSVLGALWYYGHTKYRQGWDKCTLEQDKAEMEGIKTREETRYEINRYSPSDVDKRLIDKWLRSE